MMRLFHGCGDVYQFDVLDLLMSTQDGVLEVDARSVHLFQVIKDVAQIFGFDLVGLQSVSKDIVDDVKVLDSLS